MDKKEKWEELWDEYKANKILNIEELEGKWESQDKEYRKRLSKISDSTSEEYKQLKAEWKNLKKEFKIESKKIEKYKGIAKNEAKIEKAKFERDAYQSLLDELLETRKENEEKIARRNKLEEEAKKLDKELEELKDVEKPLRIALKNPILKPEDIERVSGLLENNMHKQEENQKAFSENQIALKKELEKQIQPISEEEIKELKECVAKFNTICEKLVEGKSMGEIIADFNKEKNNVASNNTQENNADDKIKNEIRSIFYFGSQEGKEGKGEMTGADTPTGKKIGYDKKTVTGEEGKASLVENKKRKKEVPKYNINFYAKQQMYKVVYQDGIKVKIIELKLDEILSDDVYKETLKKLKSNELNNVDPCIVYSILKTGNKDLLYEYVNSTNGTKNLESIKIKYNMDGIYGRKYSSELSTEIMNYANIHKEKGLASVKKGRFTKFMETHEGIRKVWEKVSKIGAKDQLLLPVASAKNETEKTKPLKELNKRIIAKLNDKVAQINDKVAQINEELNGKQSREGEGREDR